MRIPVPQPAATNHDHGQQQPEFYLSRKVDGSSLTRNGQLTLQPWGYSGTSTRWLRWPEQRYAPESQP